MRFMVCLMISMLGGLAGAQVTPTTARQQDYLTDFSKQASARWPKNRALNIVCHGHSVPAGYFKTPEVRTFDSYPHLLHLALKERFPFAVINVTVTAIGGEASPAGAARFERDVLSLRPDVVTIDYALNDRRGGLESAREAWVSMIEQAQSKGIKVILLTPTPDTSAKLTDPADPLNQHAEQIRALAAKYQTGLADSLASFSDVMNSKPSLEEYMSQVNHPNRKGHERVAKELIPWFPAVSQ